MKSQSPKWRSAPALFRRNPILRAELLQHYKCVTFNDAGAQLSGDELVNFLRGHEKAITALEVIDEAILLRLPELQVIAKYGVGLDMIDLTAMRAHGKRLGWTGGRESTVRIRIGDFILRSSCCGKCLPPTAKFLSGTWRQIVGGNLSGRTVGIVGCGHIGKDLVGLLRAFEAANTCRMISRRLPISMPLMGSKLSGWRHYCGGPTS